MDIDKCLHGNGPECERCKAMDIPEVEEMEQQISALQSRLLSVEAQSEARRVALEIISKWCTVPGGECTASQCPSGMAASALTTTPSDALAADRKRVRSEALREVLESLKPFTAFNDGWYSDGINDAISAVRDMAEAGQTGGEVGDGE